MFEIADLCSAIGCETIVTINNHELASDMGDFVEYCWGNSSTTWGQLRVQDGHPEPYNITYVEIGNEQVFTEVYLQQIVDIASTMEQRAQQLNLDVQFTYIIGHNLNSGDLSDNMPLVQQYLEQTAFLGERVLWDLHVGADPDSVPYWESFVEQFQATVDQAGSLMRSASMRYFTVRSHMVDSSFWKKMAATTACFEDWATRHTRT
jgi:alpha-N-arabinofuranosidase